MLKYLYLSLAVLFCTPSFASVEAEEADTAASVTFKDRISIHTNTLGWVLMTPNIGLEYDLVHNKHKKISLLVSGKYNWQMNQKYDSRYLYNVAGARAELRWYFRTRRMGDLGPEPKEAIVKMGIYQTDGDKSFYTEDAIATCNWKTLELVGDKAAEVKEDDVVDNLCNIEFKNSTPNDSLLIAFEKKGYKGYKVVVTTSNGKLIELNTVTNEDIEVGKYKIIALLDNKTLLLENPDNNENWEKARVRDTRGFFNRLKAKRGIVTATQNPRTHRAYYVGPYAAYDKYSVKFGDTGYQGSAIGAGVAFGYTTPLYLYKNGNSIDLELGTALGVASVEYDKFGYNNEDKCYTNEGSEDAKILPMISDVHLSLVYRFDPIKNQVYDVDYEKLLKERFNYALRREYVKSAKKFVLPDSLKRAYTEFNREVFAYNKKIKEYNRAILKHENADSADLLIEKAPVFDYVQVPTKFLDFGSNELIQNKEINSIEELDIDYLTNIFRSYRAIDDFAGRTPAEPVNVQMVRDFNSLFSQDDTLRTEKKSYYEYLLKTVGGINENSVKRHNEAVFVQTKKDETKAADAKSDSLQVSSFRTEGKSGGIARMIKGVNKFSIKSMPDFTLSINGVVESTNLGKIETIEEKYGIAVDLGQNESNKKVDKSAQKADKAKAKADEKARKAAEKAAEKARKDADKVAEKARKTADKAAKQAREDAEKAAKKATEQAEEQVQELQQENVVEATEEGKQNTEEQTDAEVQDNNNNSEEE